MRARTTFTRLNASLSRSSRPNQPLDGLEHSLDRLASTIDELQGWAQSLGWRPAWAVSGARIESVREADDHIEVALLLAGYVDGEQGARLLRLACQECNLQLVAPPQVSLARQAG